MHRMVVSTVTTAEQARGAHPLIDNSPATPRWPFGSAHRNLLTLALILSLLLPPRLAVAWLRPGDAQMLPGLVLGMWLLKALVILHVCAAWIMAIHLPARSNTGVMAPRRSSTWAVGFLLGTALAIRLPGLNAGLWFDEIQTLVDYVSQPMGIMLTTFDSTNQHFLFSAVAQLSTGILGTTAAALRLPAVLFGVASLWATLCFARRWLPAPEAWWATIVLAVSYHHVWFSQNARGYTGLLLGTVLASTLFIDLLRAERPTRWAVWGYAWVMALTILTHVTALAVVAGHGICWLWRRRHLAAGARRWAPFVALVLAGTISLMLYAPVLPQVPGALGSSGTASPGVEWQRAGWFIAEAIGGLMRGLPAGMVLVPIAAVIVLAGIVSGWVRDPVITVMMALPMAVMALLLATTGHNLWPRFFFFGAAFVVLWAVHGGFAVLRRLMPRYGQWVGHAGLVLVTLGSLWLLPRAWAAKQDFPAARDWIAGNAAAGDRVLGIDMMDLPMNRWLELGWPIVADSAALISREQSRGRTWVAFTFPIRLQATAPALWAHLQRRYTVAHVVPATIGGGEIVIMVRDSVKRSATAPN